MVKDDHIENLLKKYYDGQTSEEEERELDKLLSDKDGKEDLNTEREVFMLIHGQDAPTPPQGMEKRLSALIDRLDGNVKHRPKRLYAMSRISRICGMAASIAAVAALGLYLNTREPNATISNEEAYAQAEQAIIKFSATLNKGLAQMEEAQAKTQEIGEKINKCIKPIEDE